MSRKKFQRAYWITVLLLLSSFIFPVFELANKPYPIIMGLPFSFFWVCLWTFIIFIAVIIFHFIDPDNKREE
ncbi:hypothetical protein [Oceanobacillus salinisoli]|uniref:hypothetical protein n=1 Tax=Oceanobacillus salinisoli TaxID=2678611 RepID=UPI0012E2B3DA|nr:hypothetical protein [Oceanobacillus salinisoli]